MEMACFSAGRAIANSPGLLHRHLMMLRTFTGLILVASIPVFGQDYEIRLHRPSRVGEKTKVLATGKESEEVSVTSAGRTLRQEKKEFSVELEGVSTTLEVSPKGKPTRLSFQIGKFVKTEAGLQKELLPRDTVVTASRRGAKMVFEVSGTPVSPEIEKALGVVISIGGTDSTDDDMFGTRERRRIGESWGVNKSALAASMNTDPRMTMRDIDGQVTLKDVIKGKPGPVLVLTVDVKGKPVPTAADQRPPVQDALMHMTGTAELPADPSQERLKETMEMTFSGRMTRSPNPNGPQVDARVLSRRSMTANTSRIN